MDVHVPQIFLCGLVLATATLQQATEYICECLECIFGPLGYFRGHILDSKLVNWGRLVQLGTKALTKKKNTRFLGQC